MCSDSTCTKEILSVLERPQTVRKIQGLTWKTQDKLGTALEYPSSGQVQAIKCSRVFSSACGKSYVPVQHTVKNPDESVQGVVANPPWMHLCSVVANPLRCICARVLLQTYPDASVQSVVANPP